jgi:hypothetical protein
MSESHIFSMLKALDDSIDTPSDATTILTSKALTDTLDKIKHEQFTANLDSMIYLFQWADKYRVYSDIDTTNTILYSAIHEFWITKISDKLAQLSKDNSTILTNFKFKFLVAKCDEIKYNTP